MRTLGYLGVFLLWNVVISGLILFLPPIVGVPVSVVAYVILLRFYLLGPRGRPRRRRALLRLRPLRPEALRWTLLSAPVLLALTWALEGVYLRLVPVPAETLDPLGPLLDRPGGALAIAILAVGIAPVVEEMFFRGLVQRSLELQLGAGWGITLASALFAAVHLLPWVFPLHFFLGAAFGFAVYATRSLWAGVLLHAVNNAMAMIGMAITGDLDDRSPTVWEIGPTPDLWTSVVVLLATAVLAVWIARRLWWAGRRPGSFR